MRFDIRPAHEADREEFAELWGTYQNELAGMSGNLDSADASWKMHMALFDEYQSGRLPGVALMAFDGGGTLGVALWGGMAGSAVMSVSESVVYGWGVYTVPEHRKNGISTALRERAIVDLADMGVQRAVGVVLLDNIAGCESSRENGFVPTDLIASMDVQEQALRILACEEPKKFYWDGLCPLCGRE